jgi:DNA invertase Pin-like site-specific DNA recombinase
MSEAERHLIRYRLTAGLRQKAVRGQLRQLLLQGRLRGKCGRLAHPSSVSNGPL